MVDYFLHDCKLFMQQDHQFTFIHSSRNVRARRPDNTITGLFLLFLFISCTAVAMGEHQELRVVLQGNGHFTKNLYQVLSKSPGNVFFSPISIHAVLSMASQGSGGKTKEALAQVLHVPDVSVAAAGYQEVLGRLNAVKNVTLHMANRIFVKEGYKLKDAFSSVVKKQFLSEVQPVDFTKKEAAAKTINTWVEKKTNEKIKDLIDARDLDVATRLVLVNAIYFKGKWAEPFDVEDTTTEKFYLNDEDTIDVQMMHISKKFYYKNDENLDAKVLELPYSNKEVSMIIILPNERNGIADLEEKLATVDLTKITENMYRPEVRVSLPKFKIETTIDLKDSLSELGLAGMFDQSADFSGMLESPEPLCVSKVIQKAFIEVNEEGAEAAAATGMGFMRCSMPPRPQTFLVDRPFVILLQAKQEKTVNVLFKGRISDPKYE